ncbi:MAG: winged helix-turn-helix transcriptional regulator [Chloroflexi bacterium]|nr:winged helix-turn-helix transcriptional regulator [Chloroflexota bacterium]
MKFNPVLFAKAIADETRQKIMHLCCCSELSVGEIVEKIGYSQPTI